MCRHPYDKERVRPLHLLEMSISEARAAFTQLPTMLTDGEVLTVTKHGKDRLAIMHWSLYERLIQRLRDALGEEA